MAALDRRQPLSAIRRAGLLDSSWHPTDILGSCSKRNVLIRAGEFSPRLNPPIANFFELFSPPRAGGFLVFAPSAAPRRGGRSGLSVSFRQSRVIGPHPSNPVARHSDQGEHHGVSKPL